MKFGDRLQEARKAKKLSQEALGVMIGLDKDRNPKATVSGWERNKHFPRVDQLAAICGHLKASADWLVLGALSVQTLAGLWDEFNEEQRKDLVKYATYLASQKGKPSGESTPYLPAPNQKQANGI